MTEQQIQQAVSHIFDSGANEIRFCELIEGVVKSYHRKVPEYIVLRYIKWKEANQDEDYQYDEIHEFMSSINRGGMMEVMESILSIYQASK
jgi:hypothetical protein